MRLNNLQKLIDKYSESLTLGELQELLQKEQEVENDTQQTAISNFIEKYKNKYLRIEDDHRFIDNGVYFIHASDIKFESFCEDMVTICFLVSGDKIQTKSFPSVYKKDDVRLYSNIEYQIISKEEYENVRSIVNKFLNDIKQH